MPTSRIDTPPTDVAATTCVLSVCMVLTEGDFDWTPWLQPLGVSWEELVVVPWSRDARRLPVPSHPKLHIVPVAEHASYGAAQRAALWAAHGRWQLWCEPTDALNDEDVRELRSALLGEMPTTRIRNFRVPRSQLAGRTRITVTTRTAVSNPTVARPIIDVIMLSYCSTLAKLEMTLDCLQSLHASTQQFQFRVILVETNTPDAIVSLGAARRLEDYAQVVHPDEPFHYNRFLQLGWQQLTAAPADYLLIVNNDLLFEPVSIEPLVDALQTYASVSPWCPDYHECVFESPEPAYFVGYRTSMEICGWALMLHRRLLEAIPFAELFPDDFAFWFQDNYYAHQLQRRGIPHALVRAAKVHHLFNQSHDLLDDEQFCEFTVGQQAVFQQKTEGRICRDGVPELSIVVDSAESTGESDGPLVSLLAQVGELPVEVLWLQRTPPSVAVDRTCLYQAARGRFVMELSPRHVVPDNFLVSCLRAITNNPNAESIAMQPTDAGAAQRAEPVRVMTLWSQRSDHVAKCQAASHPAAATAPILLSIGVLSIPERVTRLLTEVLQSLTAQASGKPVEILVFVDNQRWTVGAKRTAIGQWSRGTYLTFVDDDDIVASDYVDSLLQAASGADAPDCIVFDAWVTLNGASGKVCRYGQEFAHENLEHLYHRPPNHICCWKREIVLREPFADTSWGEDAEWAARMTRHLRVQRRIDRILYHYRWDAAGSATAPRHVTSRQPEDEPTPHASVTDS